MTAERVLSALSSPFTELLLVSASVIRVTGGQKRRRLQRAWINAANNIAAQALGADVHDLPQDPRAAAMACVRASMHLAAACGVSRLDLVEFFNLAGESGEFTKPDGTDYSIERLFAFVLAMAAQRQEELARHLDERDARLSGGDE